MPTINPGEKAQLYTFHQGDWGRGPDVLITNTGSAPMIIHSIKIGDREFACIEKPRDMPTGAT